MIQERATVYKSTQMVGDMSVRGGITNTMAKAWKLGQTVSNTMGTGKTA